MAPDPACQNLAGRVLEAFDFVQVVVVEAAAQRLAGFCNVGEVNDPTELRIELTLDANSNAERVTV